jgi:RNA polymerase sigma factor (sigma-70 family)
MKRGFQTAAPINDRSRECLSWQCFSSTMGSDAYSSAEGDFLRALQFALRATQVRAAAAVACGAVSSADREDIEQEGLIACWRALPHFDPDRASLRTFVEHVVASHLASLRRARLCRPRLQPLDDDQHEVGSAWAGDIELRSDVQRVLDGISDADRKLALVLAEHTPTEASRLVGVARSTVYERIRHIRGAFVDAGLCPRAARRP